MVVFRWPCAETAASSARLRRLGWRNCRWFRS